MLTKLFKSPVRVRELQAGRAGPLLEGFAQKLRLLYEKIGAAAYSKFPLAKELSMTSLRQLRYTFSVLGHTLGVGDAGNGLCGGMVYTVKDLFETELLPPADKNTPAAGSPLFNYLVARLTHTFDEDDVNQYLSWIQMSDHDTSIGPLVIHGLASHEITEEWPKIKSDLDAGRLCPLGLVHGDEPTAIGFFTGIQDLGKCHQVLAWGYDVEGSRLTIHIYDADFIGDDNTIILDTADPEHTTPIAVSNWAPGFYRGFFRTHYDYHDPRRPVSASFIVTVVTSPGIASAGPATPWWVDRVLMQCSAGPLVRFTGSTHDWSQALVISSVDVGKEIFQLRAVIKTGGDDLRGGTDNCEAKLKLASGAIITIQNIRILNNLLVRPATVPAGGTIHGTVSLIEAVPTPTLVGLRAVEPPPSGAPPRNPPDAHYFPTDSQHHQEGLGGEPSSGPGPHLPLLWPSSSLVSVPSSITIPAGSTMAYFNITTAHNIAAGSRRLVTIIANAVGSRYAALTVVS